MQKRPIGGWDKRDGILLWGNDLHCMCPDSPTAKPEMAIPAENPHRAVKWLENKWERSCS
jgi:hypothetical protein